MKILEDKMKSALNKNMVCFILYEFCLC